MEKPKPIVAYLNYRLTSHLTNFLRNKLEYGGKSSEVNVNLNGEVAVSGKAHANVEVVLPTERCLTFKLDRDVTEQDGVSTTYLLLNIN